MLSKPSNVFLFQFEEGEEGEEEVRPAHMQQRHCPKVAFGFLCWSGQRVRPQGFVMVFV